MKQPKPPASPVFTIRDLAILIMVIALLLAIGMPLLVARRESTRQAECANNLRSLALAFQNYESRYGRYPAAVRNFSPTEAWVSTGTENGMTIAGPNWALAISAEVGETKLYASLISCLKNHVDGPWNAADDCSEGPTKIGSFDPVGTPKSMICPSAIRPTRPHTSNQTQLANLAKGNYAACMGSGTYLQSIEGSTEIDAMLTAMLSNAGYEGQSSPVSLRGVVTVSVTREEGYDGLCGGNIMKEHRLGHGRGVGYHKIKDGHGRTMLLSEVLNIDGDGTVKGASDDIRGVWVSPSMGASTYSHLTTPNSTVSDRINGCEDDVAQYRPGSRLPCITQPASGPTAGDTYSAARSQHRGGVMGALADGSVHFYSEHIDPKVWSALGTRAAND